MVQTTCGYGGKGFWPTICQGRQFLGPKLWTAALDGGSVTVTRAAGSDRRLDCCPPRRHVRTPSDHTSNLRGWVAGSIVFRKVLSIVYNPLCRAVGAEVGPSHASCLRRGPISLVPWRRVASLSGGPGPTTSRHQKKRGGCPSSKLGTESPT